MCTGICLFISSTTLRHTTGKNGTRITQFKIVLWDFRNNLKMAALNRNGHKYGHFNIWLCHSSNQHAKSLGMQLPYPTLPHLDPAVTPPVESWGLSQLCGDLSSALDDEDGCDVEMAGDIIYDHDEIKLMEERDDATAAAAAAASTAAAAAAVAAAATPQAAAAAAEAETGEEVLQPGARQGLTLVHFSVQPELFQSLSY